MLVKLTYYGTGKPTLVNLNNVESIYQVYDKYKGQLSTKLTMTSGVFLNVEEDLQTIMKLEWKITNGVPQDFEWQSPSIDDMIESSYERPRSRKEQPHTFHRNVGNNEYNDLRY